MDSSIIAHFGGDTTDLRSATEEASIMMKGFSTGASRAVNEIGQGFVGAVVFMEAIKGIRDVASAAMDAAEQERSTAEITGEAISDHGRAWLDLKDGIGDAKSGVMGFATSVLTLFPAMGDDIGTFINDVRGISPESQAQYQAMSDSALANLAKIKSAHDKLMADLPAKQAEANAKIKALDDQLQSDQVSSGAKTLDLIAQQGPIEAQIAAIEATIAADRAAGRDTSAAQLALTNEQVALEQNQLAIHKAQLDTVRDYITEAKTGYDAAKDSMTVEEQIAALKAQEVQYQAQQAQYADNAKAQELLQNAAAADGVQIAQKQAEIRKATALSEQDQLAMYMKETPALQNLNTLTDDGYKLLQLQSKEKQNQYQIDQLVSLGVDNLNGKQKDQLNTLIEQNAQLKTQADEITAVAAAEDNLSASSKAFAQNLESADASMTDYLDTATAAVGLNLPISTSRVDPGVVGPGYGNGQIQEQYTVENNKKSIKSLIDNMDEEIQADNFSDDLTQEASIPALQKKVQDLETQLANISLSNPDGLGDGASGCSTAAASSLAAQSQQQTQLLQAIHDAVVPAFKA